MEQVTSPNVADAAFCRIGPPSQKEMTQLTPEESAELQRLMFDCTKSIAAVDFLMPNGIIILHEINVNATLAEIKEEIWEKASEYPLYGTLRDREQYHFSCVSKGVSVDLMDEEKTFLDVSPFINILKLVEKKGDESEKYLNNQIGQLIGKGLKEFDALRNPEVNDFRWKIRLICDEVVYARNKDSWAKQAQYQYPCRLAPDCSIPQYIRDKMSPDGFIYFSVQFPKNTRFQSTFTFCIKPTGLPNELIEMALNKKYSTIDTDKQQNWRDRTTDFALKIPGREEYFIEEVPLIRYMSVQEHISQEAIQPMSLVIVCKSTIQIERDQIYETFKNRETQSKLRDSFSSLTLSKKKLNCVSSWSITEPFKINIGTISKVLQADEQMIEVLIKAGLYHGNTSLCPTVSTMIFNINSEKTSLETDIEFQIEVCNIPRSSKLCFGVFEIVRNTKGKNNGKQYVENPIGWCNTAVYDYRGQLRTGSMTLYAWTPEIISGDMDIPNSLGTVVSNPNHDQAINFTIRFTKYSQNSAIMFPNNETVFKEASNYLEEGNEVPTEHEQQELHQIASRDPLTELHEQDRILLWQYRKFCSSDVPHILSKLLLCVDWSKKDEVAQMMALLEDWPELSPNHALELLDFAYPDPAIRNFAIKCLNTISDEELLLYLLQLVQALKHENYLYCHLVEFLLHRALKNMRIGHFFFWHLRSEMHVPSVSIRFGLILEAYCRGSADHMKLLEKQLTATKKFKELQGIVIENRSVREKAVIALKEKLKNPIIKSSLSRFLNPIDPFYCIDSVKVDKCKSMDSKMAPLWLVFHNSDSLGKDIYLLYKRGDDLRQDMLALQMIRIMDKLWKENGLDLRMNPYKCMSTDNKEGMIEVVTDAQTIANIHRKKAIIPMCAFRKESLLEWLKEHNSTDGSLKKAIHEFTLSCAGYCVATYVLGVMDRHSDNIMVMRTGQLFHIDFGHILGHYKEKFGIKRDRQPFVLTHDFIYVITNGSKTRSDEFISFQKYCEDAFMILRQYGSFIISLFAMMVSTGLPELQSVDKLNYLKETLQLDLSEGQARKHFRSKFDEALSNAWGTSVNWAFHSISKNNI